MKPTATLTNVARGGIVDDAALARALRERRIAAAALDVFEGEPAVHPALLEVPNVVLTPHIASASVATRRAMAELAADNLVARADRRHAAHADQPAGAGRAAGLDAIRPCPTGPSRLLARAEPARCSSGSSGGRRPAAPVRAMRPGARARGARGTGGA
jgi:hypothetical protein